jgi:hypothetical protein
MRIAGKKLSEPNIEILVLPRGEGESIIFKAKAVLNMDEFDKAHPQPSPPSKIARGGKKVEDPDNALYKKKLTDHNKRRIGYMIIKSLEATEGLEWDTVDITDPNTWGNYDKELRDSGFSDVEVMRIIQLVMQANCLDEGRLEEARESFLLTQSQSNMLSSLQEEHPNSQSGELVPELGLDRQE